MCSMPTNNRPGDDGPPQLWGLLAELTADLRQVWISAGADWLSRTDEPGSTEWRGLIRCRCGQTDSFALRTGSKRSSGWISGTPYGGTQRCDAHCDSCGFEFVLFDDGLHGYNAVVCNERSYLPAEYVAQNRTVLQPVVCDCGGQRFAVIASAIYDSEDGLELTKVQWADSYGSFFASAKCLCGKVCTVADAETA